MIFERMAQNMPSVLDHMADHSRSQVSIVRVHEPTTHRMSAHSSLIITLSLSAPTGIPPTA